MPIPNFTSFPIGKPLPDVIEATEVFKHIRTRREAFPEARFAIVSQAAWDSVSWELAYRIRDMKSAGFVDPRPMIDGLIVMLDTTLYAGVVILR